MVGQWKVSAFSIHSAASAVRFIYHVQKWSGKRHENWKANVTEEYVEVCHCGSNWMIQRCASQAGIGFLKSPSISLGVNGYAKIILRQIKCWVWGLMLHKNMIFDLKYLEPPTNAQQGAIHQGPTLVTESPIFYDTLQLLTRGRVAPNVG
jgi:hypothetical protein